MGGVRSCTPPACSASGETAAIHGTDRIKRRIPHLTAKGPAIRVQSLGHIVLKVRSLERSEAFYSGVLGIPVISRISDPVHMTFFTLGNHHDLAVMEVGEHAPSPDPTATGLAHVAFKIGDSLEEFCSVRAELDTASIAILHETDRAFTKSLHLHDPDGNEVELYIDTSDAWKTNV